MTTNDTTERLATLEAHAENTEQRLNSVERTLSMHGTKLDEIMRAVSNKREFNPGAVLSFVRDAAVLLGMAGAAIIYIATNISNTPVALLDQRITQLEQQQGWHANIQSNAERVSKPLATR